MANFDEILATLHASASLRDTDDAIVITPSRQFQVPDNYNLTIAYEGDVNSQVVTFKLPRTHEGHDLFECAKKKVKWKNIASDAEGFSTLVNVSTVESGWTCQWEIPPEATAKAGKLEVAIVLYDIATSGKLAFAWNTPKFSGFVVGETVSDIGMMLSDEEVLPAENEVLSINTETRAIISPKGYNNIVANYGDKGVSKVYFKINKFFSGINALECKIVVNVFLAKEFTDRTTLTGTAKLITEYGNKVLVCWDVDKAITNNANYYSGKFAVSLTFITGEGTSQEKWWTTSTYKELVIGESLLLTDINHVVERDDDIIKDVVREEIDTYFNENQFTIGETNN